MVLHNTMGINYNTLATLAGSKPCLFYSFERAFVGYFSGSAVSPIIKKKKKKGKSHLFPQRSVTLKKDYD